MPSDISSCFCDLIGIRFITIITVYFMGCPNVRFVKPRANGRGNYQHCWAYNVGSCCVPVGSGVQRDATTYRGKDTTLKVLETMCNAPAWPQQC